MIFGYDDNTDEVIIQDADGRITITMTYDEMMEMVDFVDRIRNKDKNEGLTEKDLEEFADSFKKFEEWKRGKNEIHGRICPKCGEVMVLCEDEKTYNEIWECDGCGYKERD